MSIFPDIKSSAVYEMRRRGFKNYTAALCFVRGCELMEWGKMSEASGEFVRCTKLDEYNPYGWVFRLFCMEDSGRYTTEELAKAAEEWHERALKFGNYYIGNQGQSSLSFTYMYRYTRAVEAVTNGTEN